MTQFTDNELEFIQNATEWLLKGNACFYPTLKALELMKSIVRKCDEEQKYRMINEIKLKEE